MLALFRSNHSTTVFILALYVAILHLPAILGWVPPPPLTPEEDGGLLFSDLFGWANSNPAKSAMVAAVLVLFQALLVNQLADTFRLLNDRNWLPGALYVLAASCLPEFLFVSPALVAVTCIPIVLRCVFSVYKQNLAFGPVFDTAFWVTMATLLYPPAVWCLPAAYFALFSLRSFSLREQMVFFSGIFTPFFLALCGYFWYNQATEFFQTQFSRWIFWPEFQLAPDLYSNVKIALLGFLLVVSLLGFNVYYYKKLIQVQKYITVLYWFFFASLAAALFHDRWRAEYFLLLMPSMGIFLAYLFESIRNRSLAEVLHLVLLGTLIFIQFFPL